MPYLSFISDKDLEQAVSTVIRSVRKKTKNIEKSFNKNVIDPFSVLFEIACTHVEENSWRKSEEIRQVQKTLSNNIGTFHETILGRIHGWEVLPAGGIIDIINRDKKIIAEIKNKHNTLNASSQKATYEALEEQILPKSSQYKDYTAYLVEIIPKKPSRYDVPFTPSDKNTGTKFAENSNLRKIDGYSFYTLASGVDNALDQLFEVLPSVIKNLYPDLATNSAFVKKFFQNCYHK